MCFYTGGFPMGFLNVFRTKPVHSIKDEVISSLRHLFSTKQSYGAWQRELGLDDYSGANYSSEVLRQIEEDIALNIKTYEKRITLLRVEISSFKSYADFEVKVDGDINGEEVTFYVHITRRRETDVSIRFF